MTATIILAMVATSVASLFSFIARLETRNERRLGAYEVGNRIILQYLDNPDEFAATLAARPIDYGRFRYRWELRVRSGEFNAAEPVQRPGGDGVRSNRTPAASLSAAPVNTRYELLTVYVWGVAIDESLDLTGDPTDGLLATLTRVADPLAMQRNPDAYSRIDVQALLTGVNNPLDIVQGKRRDRRYGPGPGVQL